MTSIELFDFPLPDELIAQRPPIARDSSRLMILSRSGGAIIHSSFASFPSLLRPGDVLVLNNTQVIPARIHATRQSGGRAEFLLTLPLGDGEWKAMAKGYARLKEGERVQAGDYEIQIASKLGDGMVRLNFGTAILAQSIISAAGQIPLPPYIKRPAGKADSQDLERYQTVFAKAPGACAAPTAGMHFTPAILETIRDSGVQILEITLHTGPGTFVPMKTANIEDHVMHPEYYEIPEVAASAINAAKERGDRIVAVGSTVTRALESAAAPQGRLQAGRGETSLFITPGYPFRIVDALLTNFHLPRSTLLVMVSAFAGRERILSAYAEAVKEKYRFFSYGDAIFIS